LKWGLEIEELEVEIERLGAQGDGVAQTPGGPVFVPFTLPGELVRVALSPGQTRAEPLAILRPSPDRVTPVCQHFGTCGGCALQHMAPPAYLDWKREQVIAALKSRGLEAPVEPMRPVPTASRRRASFALSAPPKGSPSAIAARGRKRSSISRPARCSPRPSWRACPSSKPRSRRCWGGSGKRA
jgi:tRNA/tmRNA/rRNA uracil-C5-methylase (TrmA/RlmC/RlmD family)